MFNSHNQQPLRPDMPITFHPKLDRDIGEWARKCEWEPPDLMEESELAIRRRHNEATTGYESEQARGRQPSIFRLYIDDGTTQVVYSVEDHAVVIRGYAWRNAHDPPGVWDGGFYADAEWSHPIGELELN